MVGSTRDEHSRVYRIHILASSMVRDSKYSKSGSNNSDRPLYNSLLSSIIPPMLTYIAVIIMVTITTYFFKFEKKIQKFRKVLLELELDHALERFGISSPYNTVNIAQPTCSLSLNFL